MANEYADAIFEAIDIIAEQKIKSLQYDQTVTCKILEVNEQTGCYKVTTTDGTRTFEAYSNITGLKVGDQVRVKIPNGDYSQYKYIEGKAVTENSSKPVTYVSRLDSVIAMTENLYPNAETVSGIAANNPEVKQKKLWEGAVSLANGTSAYDAIAFSAEFKTTLDNYDMREGSYGLALILSDGSSIRRFDMDSSQMFGNPYKFTVYSEQALKCVLDTDVVSMSVWLYQKNDFKCYNSKTKSLETLTPIKKEDGSCIDNIFVRNIFIAFGSDLDNYADNTVRLISLDPENYNANPDDTSRQVQLVWYNKGENDEYIGYSDGLFDSTYDENTYVSTAGQVAKLSAQRGKEVPPTRLGLTLSANLEEGIPYLEMIMSTYQYNILANINTLGNRLSGISEISTIATSNAITTSLSNLRTYSIKLKNYYTTDLKIAYEKRNGISPTVDFIETVDSGYANFAPTLNTLKNFVQNSLTTWRGILEQKYFDYVNLFTDYEARINRYIALADGYRTSFESYFAQAGYDYTQPALLASNLNLYNATEWIEDSVTSKDANKYCVYWYRYAPGARDEIAGDNWERMGDYRNNGLPKEQLVVSGVKTQYYAKSAGDDAVIALDFTDRGELEEDKYMVVLYYNHEAFFSEPITFTNLNPPTEEDTITEAASVIYIEHSTNSRNIYQSYGIDNEIISKVELNTPRKLTLKWNSPSEEELIGAQILWYVPKNNTMLTYSTYDWATDYYQTTDSSKSGYYCFYRTINSLDDRHFYYRIKDYYQPSAANNTILCVIRKAGLPDKEASVSIDFASFGTSGTDYTLRVAPVGNRPPIAINGTVELVLQLFDSNNEEIPIDGTNATLKTVTWVASQYSGYGTSNIVTVESNGRTTGIKITGVNATKGQKFNVLRVWVEVPHSTGLVAYYPLPWCSGTCCADAASMIVYNSQGNSPSYYKNPYKLFNLNSTEEIASSWTLDFFDSASELIGRRPQLSSDNILIPCNMFIPDENVTDRIMDVYAVAIGSTSAGVQWAQPIIILQNRYASAMLNEWDGSFKIDESKGTIMSTMVGAGYKSGNTFYGVLMGDVEGGSGDSATGVGLYGYQNGTQSFGFNIDGSAFIGASGAGRIYINGQDATIKSAGYTVNNGMLIDMNNARIDMKRKNGGYVWISAYEEDDSYFYITDTDGISLIYISKDNYYLQSANYPTGQYGSYLNLHNGTLDVKYKGNSLLKLQPGETGSEYYLRSDPSLSNGKKVELDLVNGSFLMESASGSIKISNESPYFEVTGPNRKLISIGANDYYLQSDNYVANESGIKIDLSNGSIDAYNFKLTSSQFKVDSNGLTQLIYIDSAKNALLYLADDEQYLQSTNYAASKGTSGIRIDLANGTIDGLSLEIHSANFDLDTTGMYLKVPNASPEKYLFHGNPENFYIQSANYTEGSAGIKFDFTNSTLDAYNFRLKATNSSSGTYFLLNSDDQIFQYCYVNGDQKVDLIKITNSDFYIQSQDWNSGASSSTTIKTGIVSTSSYYNLRSGPGTNYAIVGSAADGQKLTIYEEAASQSAGTEPLNWYRVGDGSWIYSAAIPTVQTETTTSSSGNTGMQIVLNSRSETGKVGSITAYNINNSNLGFFVNAQDATYPLSIGGSNINSRFRVGWDGSIAGGSVYNWSISATGVATFNSISSSWANISGGYIGGCEISDGTIKVGNWSLSSAGIYDSEVNIALAIKFSDFVGKITAKKRLFALPRKDKYMASLELWSTKTVKVLNAAEEVVEVPVEWNGRAIIPADESDYGIYDMRWYESGLYYYGQSIGASSVKEPSIYGSEDS